MTLKCSKKSILKNSKIVYLTLFLPRPVSIQLLSIRLPQFKFIVVQTKSPEFFGLVPGHHPALLFNRPRESTRENSGGSVGDIVDEKEEEELSGCVVAGQTIWELFPKQQYFQNQF